MEYYSVILLPRLVHITGKPRAAFRWCKLWPALLKLMKKNKQTACDSPYDVSMLTEVKCESKNKEQKTKSTRVYPFTANLKRCCQKESNFKNTNDSWHVMTADGTFRHSFSALRAGDHMATLQKNAVNHGIHAHFANIDFWTALLFRCCKTNKHNVSKLLS